MLEKRSNRGMKQEKLQLKQRVVNMEEIMEDKGKTHKIWLQQSNVDY